MFLFMLKKELKQFVRSKGNVIMMFVFPIVLIGTLGFGLDGMMTSSDEIFEKGDKDNIIYYTISDEEGIYNSGFNAFIEGVEDQIEVKFKEVEESEKIKKKVDEYKALTYINVLNDGFEIYTSKNGESFKGSIIRSIFETVLNDYAVYGTIAELQPDTREIIQDESQKFVEYEKSKVQREVSSKEYYTFAELALIILYVSVCVGESVTNENKLTTINRIRLSKVSETKIILSKVIFGVLIGLAQIFVVYLFSTFALKVDWGDNLLKFVLLYFSFSIFAAMLGAILGILCKKETSFSGVINMIIFSVCAFGGSYVPLHMLVTIPIVNKLVYLSPIYWINIATSSMITGYDTFAYTYALVIPIVLSVIILGLYLVITNRKGGLRNA